MSSQTIFIGQSCIVALTLMDCDDVKRQGSNCEVAWLSIQIYGIWYSQEGFINLYQRAVLLQTTVVVRRKVEGIAAQSN